MNVRYRVTLTQYERDELGALLSGGKHSARKLRRAQILLAADAGATDEEIANTVGVGSSTVYRTKKRFVGGNGAGAEREPASRRRPQAQLEGGSPAGSNRVLDPTGRVCALDARPARGRDGEVDPAR